jgi:transcriptional regulator with XRE-family HTH domain
MGTSQSAVSNMESGKTLPTLSVLERFAEATGRPLTIVLGAPSRLAGREERRRRVRLVLGDYRFDPWERRPSKVEAQSLEADGLTRERFEGSRAAEGRRR